MFTVTSLGHARRIEIIESPWSWASYFLVEILHSMKILLYTAVYQIYRLYKLFLRCIPFGIHVYKICVYPNWAPLSTNRVYWNFTQNVNLSARWQLKIAFDLSFVWVFTDPAWPGWPQTRKVWKCLAKEVVS